jgi:hypothetical protein
LLTTVFILLYSTAFGYLFGKTTFVKRLGITRLQFWLAFTCKVLVGLLATYLIVDFKDIPNDIEGNQIYSLVETKNLLQNPSVFFFDIFSSGYSNGYGTLFGSDHSFVNDFRSSLIPKIMGIGNLLGNYSIYVNSLFFIFIGFVASCIWYKLLQKWFNLPNWFYAVVLLLLPSIASFSGTICKDLVLFFGLGLLFYALFVMQLKNKKRWLFVIAGFLMVFVFRSFIAIALLPFMMGYYVNSAVVIKPAKLFALVFIVSFLLVFISGYLSNVFNVYTSIFEKQQSFIALGKSTTDFKYVTLTEEPTSLIKALPSGIYQGFVAPAVNWYGNWGVLPFSLEMALLLALVLLLVFRYKKTQLSPSVYAVFFAFVFIILFTGLTITNVGSVIRYRSIYLPFLYCFFAAHINLDISRKVLTKNGTL